MFRHSKRHFLADHGHGPRHAFRSHRADDRADGPPRHGHHHRDRHRPGWDEARGGGPRRRLFESGALRLLLLKLIAEQPRHGYELIRAIETMSGGAYVPSPGVVYPTLTLLQEMGLIAETGSDGGRKTFALADDGTAHLAAHAAELDAVTARLAGLAERREQTDRGPIRRALQNLRAVLMERFDRPDVSPETLHQAAALLDETAQKIERL